MSRANLAPWIIGLLLPGAGLADDSAYVPLMTDLLVSRVIGSDPLRAPAQDIANALGRSRNWIKDSDQFQHRSVAEYARTHSVQGHLEYVPLPISWQRLAAEDDQQGMAHFIALLTGASTDLEPLLSAVTCPRADHQIVCIAYPAMYTPGADPMARIPFGVGAVDPLVAFAQLLGASSSDRVRLRSNLFAFRHEGGGLIDGEYLGLQHADYRIYDDKVELGVTNTILPASARDMRWLYAGYPSEYYWAVNQNLDDLTTGPDPRIVFPRHFASTAGQFSWYLQGLHDLTQQPMIATDIAIESVFLGLGDEARAMLEQSQQSEGSVDLLMTITGADIADLAEYVTAEPGRGQRYRAVSVASMRIDAVQINIPPDISQTFVIDDSARAISAAAELLE